MAGYIHDDIGEIMEDAASKKNAVAKATDLPSTDGWSEEQLKSLNLMLQYAWNRGYKSACQDRDEQE